MPIAQQSNQLAVFIRFSRIHSRDCEEKLQINLNEVTDPLSLITDLQHRIAKLVNKNLEAVLKGHEYQIPLNLTKRELEILQLLGTSFSNQEIADQLHISPGTLKWHTNNIYSKLGVQQRLKAIEKAKSLQLI